MATGGPQRPGAAVARGERDRAGTRGSPGRGAVPVGDSGDGPVRTRGDGGASGAEAEALASALDRVGDRWALQVVHALLDGPRRFGELHRTVAPISTNVLTQRLRSLEAAGVVVAEPYQQRPPRFRYRLTGRGEDLVDALRVLAAWAATDPGTRAAAAPAHGPCGTPLEPRWWCPTCAVTTDGDAELIRC
jgi:DNA-binding HxlR family transcriptional regulator